MDAVHNVPDSTDWLDTPLKSLAELESALHCQICKEFYDTPMITSCNHTFCSRCIRTSLSADGKCPACRAADQANKLRNNWAIQEVVSAFIAARPAALEVATKARDEATQAKRPGKRKRATIPDSDDLGNAESGGRTTRSKSRRVASSQNSQPEQIEIDDSDSNDVDFEPAPPLPQDDLVECPMGCGRRMKIEAVEPHLDKCEEERAGKIKTKAKTFVNGLSSSNSSSSQTTRPQDRIAELNYSMMKEPALTRKFNELGIPTWGGKQLMVNRHREWVNIWNANCDSNHPRTKRELLRDLDNWERTQGGNAPRQHPSVMRKDFDAAGWATKNKDDFSRLIADAKRKKAVTTAAPKEKEEGINVLPSQLDGQDETSPFFPSSSMSQTANAHDKIDVSVAHPYADNPETTASNQAEVEALNNGQQTKSIGNQEFQRPESASLDTATNAPSLSLIKSDQDPPSIFGGITPSAQHSPPASAVSHHTHMSPSSHRSPELQRDEHTALRNTDAECDLPAHFQSPTAKKVPMFAVPQQPVMDVDGGGNVN